MLPALPRKKVLFLAIAAAVVAGVVVIYLYWRSLAGGVATITVSGNVEATEAHLAFKLSGRIKRFTVEEGALVAAEQEVACLEDDDLRANEAEAQAAVEVARAAVAQAEAAAAVAQAHLRELEAGARPQEVERAAAEVQLAEAELERARSEWERIQKLFNERSATESQRDAAKAEHDKAAARCRAAREALALVKAGARAETIEAARAEVARTQAAVRAAQAQVHLAEARLALVRVQIGYARLHSPLAGRVVRKNVEVGELVVAGTPVLTVANIRQPWVRAFINEPDLGRVRLGARATVRMDGSSRTFSGRVAFISDVAEFTPKNIETRAERVRLVYRVKILVENPEEVLKPGMPVEVDIEIARAAEASQR